MKNNADMKDAVDLELIRIAHDVDRIVEASSHLLFDLPECNALDALRERIVVSMAGAFWARYSDREI